MALHVSRASDKLVSKMIQDRIADGSIVASPPTGQTNPGIVTAPITGLNTVKAQPSAPLGAQHPTPLPVIRDPKTPPVTLGQTKSIKDVLAELAARGQAPASVGKCRVEGCEERGWIEDGGSWLCVHHMHSHATRKPFNPADHPLRPSAPPDQKPTEPPKPEQTKPVMPAPMLMLPAPQIVGLLPAGQIAAVVPPAEDAAEAAPVAVETQIVEFPAHRVIAAPSEREVNPAWVAAFKAAHGKQGTEAIKALIDQGAPEAYVSAVKDAVKSTAKAFETNPKIAPIAITDLDTMPGLMPAAPYPVSDIELAYEQRVQTVRRMMSAERAAA